MLRRVRFTPGGPNEAWSLDFVADQPDEGRRVRALTLVDAVTPESRALEGGRSLRGEHVVVALSRIGAQRGTRKGLFWDNGSAFCSRKVDLWADQHRVRIEVSRSGKPTDHASVKPFTGTIGEECLNAHGFES